MRFSDWSSDVCSSDLPTGDSHIPSSGNLVDLDTVHKFKRHGAIPRKNRGLRGQASPPPVRGRSIFVGAQNGQDAAGHAGVCRFGRTGISLAVGLGDFSIAGGSPPFGGLELNPHSLVVVLNVNP